MSISGARYFIVLAVLIAGSFAVALNGVLVVALLKPIGAEFGLSDAAAGQLATVARVASVGLAVVAAPWLDRLTRKFWLRLGVTALAVGMVLSIGAPSSGWLYAGFLFGGIGQAILIPTSLAAPGDLFPDAARRHRALGLVWVAVGSASAIGLPIVAQLEAALGWRWAMLSLLVPIGLVWGGTWAWPAVATITGRSGVRDYFERYRQVFGNRETVWLLGVAVIHFLVYSGWQTYSGAFAITVFAADANTLSLLFLVNGTLFMLGSWLAPLLIRRFSARPVFVGGVLALALSLLATGTLVTHAWMLYPYFAIIGLAMAVLSVTLSTLIMESLPAARGAAMSLQAAATSMGTMLGSVVVGLGLVLFGEYEASYRSLGLILPLALICLLLSRRGVPVPKRAIGVTGED